MPSFLLVIGIGRLLFRRSHVYVCARMCVCVHLRVLVRVHLCVLQTLIIGILLSLILLARVGALACKCMWEHECLCVYVCV